MCSIGGGSRRWLRATLRTASPFRQSQSLQPPHRRPRERRRNCNAGAIQRADSRRAPPGAQRAERCLAATRFARVPAVAASIPARSAAGATRELRAPGRGRSSHSSTVPRAPRRRATSAVEDRIGTPWSAASIPAYRRQSERAELRRLDRPRRAAGPPGWRERCAQRPRRGHRCQGRWFRSVPAASATRRTSAPGRGRGPRMGSQFARRRYTGQRRRRAAASMTPGATAAVAIVARSAEPEAPIAACPWLEYAPNCGAWPWTQQGRASTRTVFLAALRASSVTRRHPHK